MGKSCGESIEKMRILVLGKKNLMQWPENTASALSKQHDVKLFLYNNMTVVYGFWKCFGKDALHGYLAQKLEKLINSFKPELIVIPSVFFLPQELFDVLKKHPEIKRVGWAGDNFDDNARKKSEALDFLFCSDTGYLEEAQKFSCISKYLPLCVNENIFKNDFQKKTLPPFFVGIANKTRTEYLKKCSTPCLIYGKRWDKKYLNKHIVHNTRLSLKQAQKFVSKSIAPFNLSFAVANVNGLNFRIFEIPACGSLIITNNAPDLSLCYDIGSEAVVYNTPEEFSNLISDIVKYPEKYEQISHKGYLKTMQCHTFEKRMEQMLMLIEHKDLSWEQLLKRQYLSTTSQQG